MASIRKRTWTTGGETRTAWICDYTDQAGRRRLKTFKTRKAADQWLVTARGEVARGTHVADSASITVAQAGVVFTWPQLGTAGYSETFRRNVPGPHAGSLIANCVQPPRE